MHINYKAFERDRILYGVDITDIWDYIDADGDDVEDDEMDEEEYEAFMNGEV